MTLIPYMAGFIAGAVAWKLGSRFGGMFAAIIASLTFSTLAWYYTRRYMKDLRDSMGK